MNERTPSVLFVLACWLFGHDFVGEPGNFCIHCGKRPQR